MNAEDELLPLVTLGEILAEEFLIPLGISQYRVAKEFAVPPRRINEIVHGLRAITPDTALRLAKYIGTTPHFWINLQTDYELRKLAGKDQFPQLIVAKNYRLSRSRVPTAPPEMFTVQAFLHQQTSAAFI